MRKITNTINGMMFVVPDNHPNQPEWGRPAEVRQIDELFDINTLDERDRNRIELQSPTCISFKAEWTEEPYIEPLTRIDYDNALEAHFLSVAKAWDYISIDRLIGYATSSRPQWKADALAFIEWRDSCVDKSYQVLAKVLAGDMVQPSIAEFIALMPKPPDQPKV